MLFHMSIVPPVGRLAQGWSEIAHYGGLGVDVFFVLSGFLITGILLDARTNAHYFRNFYARRILRIFPLYYAVTAFSFVVLPRLAPWTIVKFGPANQDSIWYWLHLSNFSIARRGEFIHGIMDVSWSLAIEEQFYLLWPAVVLLTAARRLPTLCLLLIAGSCASRVLLTLNGTNPIAVYTLTFCRLDGLALGALIAWTVRRMPAAELRVWIMRGLVGSLGILIATLVPLTESAAAARDAGLVRLLASCVTGGAILGVVTAPTPIRFFELRPFRALGRLSYGLYLFHYPIAAVLRDKVLPPARMPLLFGSSLPSQIIFCMVATALAFSAALLSWHVYERRFLKLKQWFE